MGDCFQTLPLSLKYLISHLFDFAQFPHNLSFVVPVIKIPEIVFSLCFMTLLLQMFKVNIFIPELTDATES